MASCVHKHESEKVPVEILYFEIRIEIRTKGREIKFEIMLEIHT